MLIESFTLVNADTGIVVLDPIPDGAEINLDEVGYSLSIIANVDVCAVGVGSVKWTVNDVAFSVDNTFPYTIKGDTGKPDCRFNAWQPGVGEFEIEARPYAGINATGTSGTNTTITLTFVADGNVPTGLDGWTPAFTETGDTVKKYVSSSTGNDSNAGTSGSPYLTLAKAMSVMRDGMPDWIYLKRGDTWTEDFSGWTQSGKSETEPKLITYYSSGNPPRIVGKWSTNTQRNVDHIAIVGVEFWRADREPGGGGFSAAAAKQNAVLIRANAPMNGFLIEGCRFGYGAVEIINDVQNFRFRRNTHAGNYLQNPTGVGTGLKAFSLYISNRGRTFTVEENIFDYGGWNATLTGTERSALSHCCYFDAAAGPGLVRRNIACRGSNQGLMLRCGGDLRDNLLVECAVVATVGTRPSKILDNVCLSGADFSASVQRGYGPEARATPVMLIDGNVIANKTGGVGTGDAITLSYKDSSGWHAGDPPIRLPVNPSIVVTNNVFYNWNGSFRAKIFDGTLTVTGNRFVDTGTIPAMNLDFTTATLYLNGNKWYCAASAGQQMKLNGTLMSFSTWVAKTGDGSSFATTTFVAATRTLQTYNVTLGGASTINSFMTTALAMWRESWNTDYTATLANVYIRAGFVET